MLIDSDLLDEVTAKAGESPRLRMNFNLHDSLEAKAQRLINVLLPGTILPIHRHRHTAETYILLRGRMLVVFYNEMGARTEQYLLDPSAGNYGVQIPAGLTYVCAGINSVTECDTYRYPPTDMWRVGTSWNYNSETGTVTFHLGLGGPKYLASKPVMSYTIMYIP